MIGCIEYRTRISQFNKELNAFIDFTDETGDALAWGVKSNIAVKGLPLTAGCAKYKNSIAQKDAKSVSKIRESGGIILGTVNMHEGALGATTDNPTFGRTENPWRIGYTPGGSSGGSAVAVSAGLCDVALGTDTMGSVRIPSAYCGVHGHKPTSGLISTSGVIPLSTTLDHIGPIARDVDTLWQAMKILSSGKFENEIEPIDLRNLSIGIWTGIGETNVSDTVAIGFQKVIDQIVKTGAKTSDFHPPEYQYSKSRRAGLLISEIEAATVHGISSDEPNPKGLSDDFIQMMRIGLSQSAEKKSFAYDHLTMIKMAAKNIWSEIDFILSPTAPQQAFNFAEIVPANQADFTAWANFANLPATSVFSGISDDNLPLAVQVIAPTDRDCNGLRLAKALEGLFGKPPIPPKYNFSKRN